MREIVQSVVTRMAAVAVPRRVETREDGFRGRLEFETGAIYRFHGIDNAPSIAADQQYAPAEIVSLREALRPSELLVGLEGPGSYILRFFHGGQHILLGLQPINGR